MTLDDLEDDVDANYRPWQYDECGCEYCVTSRDFDNFDDYSLETRFDGLTDADFDEWFGA